MAPDQPEYRPRRDVIVIGGSAGSLQTLCAIAQKFPADFPGTVFVALDIGQSRSILPELLTKSGKLTASHPREEEPISRGRIYIAPPDRHLLIEDAKVCLSRGPRDHFTRPAIDPLFRSAAATYGPRVIGVILSGRGSDGAGGLDAIQRAGGLAVIEDPSDTAFPDMPRNAASVREPPFLAHAAEILSLLVRLSEEVISAATVRARETPVTMGMDEFERPAALSCPECGGALRLILNDGLRQYRCHVGHRFGATEILESQSEGIEKGIYVALRMLNEQAEFARQMIETARDAPLDNGLVFWQRLQAQAEEQIETLRHFLERRPAVRLEPGSQNVGI